MLSWLMSGCNIEGSRIAVASAVRWGLEMVDKRNSCELLSRNVLGKYCDCLAVTDQSEKAPRKNSIVMVFHHVAFAT